MLKKLWKNWNDKNDAKLRAQHEKRDAELGKPSQQTAIIYLRYPRLKNVRK